MTEQVQRRMEIAYSVVVVLSGIALAVLMKIELDIDRPTGLIWVPAYILMALFPIGIAQRYATKQSASGFHSVCILLCGLWSVVWLVFAVR